MNGEVKKGQLRLGMEDGKIILEGDDHRYHAHYKNLVIDVTDGVRELMRQARQRAALEAVTEMARVTEEQQQQLVRYRQILATVSPEFDFRGPTT